MATTLDRRNKHRGPRRRGTAFWLITSGVLFVASLMLVVGGGKAGTRSRRPLPEPRVSGTVAGARERGATLRRKPPRAKPVEVSLLERVLNGLHAMDEGSREMAGART